MTMIDRLIEQASKWNGYLEKKSNAYLDDFTKNAGSNNYTCFNRDYCATKVAGGSINMQWCAAFVSMCFVYEFGLEKAQELLCKNLHCYTPYGAQYFKDKGRYIKRGQGLPKRGDVVFFYSSSKGRIGHVGIVYNVSGNTVYTIEGNTSGANYLVTNGGGVKKKSYSLGSSYIDGYGRPTYDDVDNDGFKPLELGDRTLRKGDCGVDVKELQQTLLTLKYNLGKYGADGDFGSATEGAVKAFQKDEGLEVDGVFGPASWEKLQERMPEEGGGSSEPEPEEPDVKPEPEQAGNVVIEEGQAYIRTGPASTFASCGVAKKGERFEGVETAGWVPIVIDGEVRWISGKYAKIKE